MSQPDYKFSKWPYVSLILIFGLAIWLVFFAYIIETFGGVSVGKIQSVSQAVGGVVFFLFPFFFFFWVLDQEPPEWFERTYLNLGLGRLTKFFESVFLVFRNLRAKLLKPFDGVLEALPRPLKGFIKLCVNLIMLFVYVAGGLFAVKILVGWHQS